MVDQEYDSALDAQTPIIENMVVGVPPVFEGLTRQLDKIVEQPLLGPRSDFPRGKAAFASVWLETCVLMRLQLRLHMRRKMFLGIEDRKLLPTEGIRRNSLRTPWVLSEAQ
jgi:hypothetical protein